ncbi:hypothetical protein Tco_1286804, partial [Tanacetum coccineum]
WLREVQFLRHVINGNEIHVDPSKIEVVKNGKPLELQLRTRLCVNAKRTKSVIYMDHKSLQHIFSQKELNMRQRGWIELFRRRLRCNHIYGCDVTVIIE